MDKPIILKEGNYSKTDISSLREGQKVFAEIDIYENQLNEMFEIETPHLLSDQSLESLQKKNIENTLGNDPEIRGNWVYFPWSGKLLHIVVEGHYYKLRTNRNKNLITEDEQNKLSSFTVGIVGLSIGGNIAANLAYSGISNTMKLADFDTLETTNLNRVQLGIDTVGKSKVEGIAHRIYEINPYADLHLFTQGLKVDTLGSFIDDDPKPKLLVDAIDDIEMKIRLRMYAREVGIPVVMFTNLGDSVLIDIERYDQDKNTELFNGLLGKESIDEILKGVPKEHVNKYAVEIVGRENVPQRAIESVKEIGKTLVGRPQLMSTVSISSGVAPYLIRKIILNNNVNSGRRRIDFDSVLFI